MPQNISAMAARLQRDVPNAETSIDDALIALLSLTTSVVTARRETGVPAKTGHGTIARLVEAQASLVKVSGQILRAHGELVEIGRETAGYDLRECPEVGAPNAVGAAAAA
ncbi:hypothetical protein GGC65_004304 [Sphingopyxis sp. OAS728]|uniref:hypothetical protein n=1 Tax=Sphingopyxis sp. OAS728 TaxID=2663823 RepID=UPI00178A192C|nr:hypothetical protein [Sphingopyxis sp. OAS728]MBE1529848.1 hypothetical protein [Sphingopyxis sp. OAS728]